MVNVKSIELCRSKENHATRLGVGALLGILLVIASGCGKPELSRSKALDLIQGSREIANQELFLPFHETGLAKSIEQEIIAGTPYEPTLSPAGRELLDLPPLTGQIKE